MTFHDQLARLLGQRVLVNANGFEGKYAVGTVRNVERDFFTVDLEKEEVRYPLTRVLEVSKTRGGLVYVPVNRNSRIELQTPGETDEPGAPHLIRLNEAS